MEPDLGLAQLLADGLLRHLCLGPAAAGVLDRQPQQRQQPRQVVRPDRRPQLGVDLCPDSLALVVLGLGLLLGALLKASAGASAGGCRGLGFIRGSCKEVCWALS